MRRDAGPVPKVFGERAPSELMERCFRTMCGTDCSMQCDACGRTHFVDDDSSPYEEQHLEDLRKWETKAPEQ